MLHSCSILMSTERLISVEFDAVDRQTIVHGLFALAFATALCRAGEEPPVLALQH